MKLFVKILNMLWGTPVFFHLNFFNFSIPVLKCYKFYVLWNVSRTCLIFVLNCHIQKKKWVDYNISNSDILNFWVFYCILGIWKFSNRLDHDKEFWPKNGFLAFCEVMILKNLKALGFRTNDFSTNSKSLKFSIL